MNKNSLLTIVALAMMLGLTACEPHSVATSPLLTPVSPLSTSTPLPSPTWTPTVEPSPMPTETPMPTPTQTPVPTPAPPYTAGIWECWDRGRSMSCPYDASLSLKQMAFVSDTEAWAVGGNGYIARWDGYTWTRVASPTDQDLNDVVFLSPGNGWAVGEGGLILHWDGNRWLVVRDYQPPLMGSGNYLIWTAIAFSSPDDGWVVGDESSEGGGVAYVMHWNSVVWEEPPMPPPYDDYTSPPFLLDVVAFTPQDVWAVGESYSGGLTLHWDGSHWYAVPNPFSSLRSGRYWLYSISALSPDDIWVAGIWLGGAGWDNKGLVIHWDGVEWTDMQLPETGWVNSILMVSQDDGWVGGDELFHWNGRGWEKATRPMVKWDRIVDIERSPNGEIWALIEHGAFLHLEVAK